MGLRDDETMRGRWLSRAIDHVTRLTTNRRISESEAGYGDALLAAGIALDLAERKGDANAVEYARKGWSAAMADLVPPPVTRPHPPEGVSDGHATTEFERLADAFYADASGPDVRNPPQR